MKNLECENLHKTIHHYHKKKSEHTFLRYDNTNYLLNVYYIQTTESKTTEIYNGWSFS